MTTYLRSRLMLLQVLLSWCPTLFAISVAEEVGSKNTGGALSQFDMMLKTEIPNSLFYDGNFVVKKGLISKDWSPSCAQDETRSCKLRAFDEYTDQLTFEFLYRDPSLFKFKSPVVKARGGRAQPQIQSFLNDVEEKSGEIVVFHNCSPKNGSEDISEIELSFDISDDISMNILWDKKCGHGEYKNIDFGIMSDATEGSLNHFSLKDVTNREKLPTFGPSVLSTRVYLRLTDEGHSQHFSAPTINVMEVTENGNEIETDGALTVEMKGGHFGGMIISNSSSVFDVFYSCHRHGIYKVMINIKVIPYNDLQLEWKKDCGGGIEELVNIGTKGDFMDSDVISRGRVTEKYGEASSGMEQGAVIGQGAGTKAFFVWIDGDKTGRRSSVRIGETSVHSFHKYVGDVRIASAGEVVTRIPANCGYLGEHGEMIRGPDRRILAVHVTCFRKGRMRVGVTMTFQDREAIEWWFYNDCEKVVNKKKQKWFPTAEVMMYGTLLMFGMVVVSSLKHGCSIGRKRGAVQRYQELVHGRRAV